MTATLISKDIYLTVEKITQLCMFALSYDRIHTFRILYKNYYLYLSIAYYTLSLEHTHGNLPKKTINIYIIIK